MISYICNTVKFSFPFSCLVALANGFTKTLNRNDETPVCLGSNLGESIQFPTVKSDVNCIRSIDGFYSPFTEACFFFFLHESLLNFVKFFYCNQLI